MDKKMALIAGCVILYILLMIVTGGAFRIILILALIAYGMYRYG